MILNVLKYYVSFVPKLARFPLLVMIVSIPFIISSLVYDYPLHSFHLMSIASVIAVQIYFSRRGFNTCGTCGHERHMHDKRDLVKRGFDSLTQIVCDKFRKGTRDPKNYDRMYWNGRDLNQGFGV